MKYGETLRQRSIPAWSHQNIDYDDIKHFIKEQTTPGKGKTVSVPGRGDDKLKDFESSLFQILAEQHQRIDLFVKSKAGEIQRRLDHAKKQLKQLKSRSYASDSRIPISRLERYSRLENDVIKAGEEIKSLSRFVSTQRTAIRKLLKKYKKWTGSRELEDKFQQEVLDDPKSFTKLDFGSLLDDYSETLLSIRSLYESRLQGAVSKDDNAGRDKFYIGSSSIGELRSSLATGTKREFDTAFATAPFGDRATMATYFVHPDNVVELQVLLLQHAHYYSSGSRKNSSASADKTPSRTSSGQPSDSAKPDFGVLIADRLSRFAQEQSSLTVDEREHDVGSAFQKAHFCARWQDDEYATLSARDGRSFKHAQLKRKHLDAFFAVGARIDGRRPSLSAAMERQDVAPLQSLLASEANVSPLSTLTCSRSRFAGLNNSPQSMLLAVLDTNIYTRSPQADPKTESTSFPFALLWIRQEGACDSELVASMDKSHLVERVRGFSMEYHAVWQTCQPSGMAPPFWIPMLSQDIRKLPPPALKKSSSLNKDASAEQSTTQTSTSSGSVVGLTEGTTAVEDSRPSTSVDDLASTPPLRAFRKKKRRSYRETDAPQNASQKYWSEYDNPEDGDEGEGAYVLYIDPNEKSSFDMIFAKLRSIFFRNRRSEVASRNHLSEEDDSPPSTPKDDETSSDEESGLATSHKKSYGTIQPQSSVSSLPFLSRSPEGRRAVPQLTAICMGASMAILIVAYILATTGKHKYAREVVTGVVFAIGTSLVFAIMGVASMLGRNDLHWTAWVLAIGLLIVDAVASGGLLAWMLG